MANESLTDSGVRNPSSDTLTSTPSLRKRRMSDSDLLALIASHERASLGSQVAAGATISTTIFPSNQAMTTLELDRYNALNAFLARPLGNEVENRSPVVLPVLRDTLSWIMPQLMRIFAGSKSICRFDPVSQNDENQAEMETAVVNHIFMQENNGLLILHDFCWDALIMRNGYAEVYTRKSTKIAEETYEGMNQIELVTLLQDTADEELEVLEQREYLKDLTLPAPQLPPTAPPLQQTPRVVAQIPTWDLKIRRTKKCNKLTVTCLPPEEMRVTPRAREGMEDITFSMHQATKTRSDLITDGYDRDIVNGAASGRPNWLEIDALARNQVVDQLSIENPSDHATQEIEIRKVVMQVDYDGDDIAELRRIVIAGDKILENDVVEETPFVSGQPMRMPHRHTGMSLYDLVMDLQIIQTQLWRAGLDNLTVANNLRIAVDWRNVNMDDLLTSRPHGPIRGNGPPAQWIQPIQMPSNIISEVLPAMDYIDRMRSNRTGIGKGTMGLDADELQDVTKGGQLASMSAAALIVELIARLLAEGIKGIFLKIHSELTRHQDKPMEYQISGKWVTVNPAQWRRRTSVTPNVGLGSGNREEMRANIQQLVPAQAALMQAMMTAPPQVYRKAYEMFKLVCEALGFSNPERFGVDPDSDDYKQLEAQRAQQPQPVAPQVQAAKIRSDTELQVQREKDQRAAAADQKDEQIQLLKERMQMMHEAIQDHAQRNDDAVATRNDELLALAKILAPIIASQKEPPEANAGEILAQDTKAAEAGMHEKLAASLDGLTQALGNMGKPRVATLSDGRQIRIE